MSIHRIAVVSAAALASMSFGCSSGSSASAPSNVSPDGTYAFDGAGWKYDDGVADQSEPHWTDGTQKLFVDQPISPQLSAEAWATGQFNAIVNPPSPLVGAPSLFDPTPLPGTSAYWYGFIYEGNAYEAYWVRGSEDYHVEISGPELSQAAAAGTLSTFRILK